MQTANVFADFGRAAISLGLTFIAAAIVIAILSARAAAKGTRYE